jgi:tetratricopeptide (TPR) repeat protein
MKRVATLAAALLLGACATTGAPDSPTVTPKQRPALAKARHDKARALEADGQLRAALLEWKIARTIDPQDGEARTQEQRVESQIASLVSDRMGEARAALARKAHLQARRKLLAVLALDPGHTAAVEMLRNEVRDVESVAHTVRAGETLASLAERYYGDRARGEVIWETNNLPPGRPLAAGAVLRIPEIPGVPFYAPGRKPPPAPTPPPAAAIATPATPAPPVTLPRPDVKQDEPPEVNPMLAEIREAIDRKEYGPALTDIDRYLKDNPRDREGLETKKLVLYRHGQTLLDEKKYDDSYKALTQLARLQPDYQDLGALLQRARRQVIDRHYQEGIRHYRDERLKEAIAEWKLVLEMEPNHQNAKRNVEQAEKLLQGLERRKR